MPQPTSANRRARRKAKFGITKEAKIEGLEGQVNGFKNTLFSHEANIDRLVDRFESLPPAPTDGSDDPYASERESLDNAIIAEEKAMDIIEAAIESTRKKIADIKAGS